MKPWILATSLALSLAGGIALVAVIAAGGTGWIVGLTSVGVLVLAVFILVAHFRSRSDLSRSIRIVDEGKHRSGEEQQGR